VLLYFGGHTISTNRMAPPKTYYLHRYAKVVVDLELTIQSVKCKYSLVNVCIEYSLVNVSG